MRSGSASTTFLPDDRDASKILSVALQQLCANLAHCIASDPNWQIRSDSSASQVLLLAFGRAHAALPTWFRGNPRGRSGPLAPPHLTFLKSKCFTDEGEKTCQKAGHFCLRRLLNMSSMPLPAAWRTVARRVRAIVEASTCTREVVDAKDAAPLLRVGFRVWSQM